MCIYLHKVNKKDAIRIQPVSPKLNKQIYGYKELPIAAEVIASGNRLRQMHTSAILLKLTLQVLH